MAAELMSGKPVAWKIAGGTTLSAGPAGRLTADGKPPHCTQCGSLERHRANRRISRFAGRYPVLAARAAVRSRPGSIAGVVSRL